MWELCKKTRSTNQRQVEGKRGQFLDSDQRGGGGAERIYPALGAKGVQRT